MIRAKFKETDHGWKKWAKALRFLGGKQSTMEVGLLEGETDPDVIYRGWVNEVGAPRANIPPRPWFRTTLDVHGDKYLKLMGRLFVEEMEKGMPGGDARIKEAVAEEVVKDLKTSIVKWSSPANKASTVKKKGFNDPLIETGELAAAPTYKITKPGES